jgi:hypothetical protein
MKCAKELELVRKQAIELWRKEALKEWKKLEEESKNFCDNVIGVHLNEIASNPQGGAIKYLVSLATYTDKYNHQVLCPLGRDGNKYADGTLSYSTNTNIRYSKEVLEEYLTAHCLTVQWGATDYMRYGWGSCEALTLIVSVE